MGLSNKLLGLAQSYKQAITSQQELLQTLYSIGYWWSFICRHSTELYYTTVHCSTPQCIAVQYSAMKCSTVQCSALHYTALNQSTVQCSELHCNVLHFIALYCTATLYIGAKRLDKVQPNIWAVNKQLLVSRYVQVRLEAYIYIGAIAQCLDHRHTGGCHPTIEGYNYKYRGVISVPFIVISCNSNNITSVQAEQWQHYISNIDGYKEKDQQILMQPPC